MWESELQILLKQIHAEAASTCFSCNPAGKPSLWPARADMSNEVIIPYCCHTRGKKRHAAEDHDVAEQTTVCGIQAEGRLEKLEEKLQADGQTDLLHLAYDCEMLSAKAKRDAIQELQDEKELGSMALRHFASAEVSCAAHQDTLEAKLEKKKKENRDLKEEVEESIRPG